MGKQKPCLLSGIQRGAKAAGGMCGGRAARGLTGTLVQGLPARHGQLSHPKSSADREHPLLPPSSQPGQLPGLGLRSLLPRGPASTRRGAPSSTWPQVRGEHTERASPSLGSQGFCCPLPCAQEACGGFTSFRVLPPRLVWLALVSEGRHTHAHHRHNRPLSANQACLIPSLPAQQSRQVQNHGRFLRLLPSLLHG